MEDCENVTLIEEERSPRRMSPVVDEISSTRRMIFQGEGSSSHDQPVAIANEHNVLQSVVVESPLPPRPPPPQPQPQPCIRDAFRRDIMNEGCESVETCGESSNNTKPGHKIQSVSDELWWEEETGKYYHPELVSIGPYYRYRFAPRSFDKFKFQFAGEYVKSCGLSINELYNKVAEVAGEARRCYAEDTTEEIDDTTFTEMMFLDGCFILQFIWCVVKNEVLEMKNEVGQLEIMKSHDIALVQRDLFLLGNQLPFKVLLALMSSSFDEESIEIFNIIHLHQRPKIRALQLHFRETSDKPVHLLENMWVKNLNSDHHIRLSSLPSNSGRFPRRSAMDLKMVGIQFRPYDHDLLSYIAFKSTWNGGILTLSKINIDETTVSLLLNLVAYEHCPDTTVSYFWATNYICFLDSIIDSANDVKELKYAGIISNFLRNDDEVVNVIHRMAARLVPDYRHKRYFLVMSSIEKYHSHKSKTRIASWIAEVMRDHFRSPWTAIAVLAALFAIFLTTVQTYFTAFPHTDKCQESICNYLKNNTLQSNGG